MPNKRNRKNRSVKCMGDITLDDFANSTVCKNRLKKSSDNVNKTLKSFEDTKTWEEKVDGLEESDLVSEIDDEGNVTFSMKKVESRRRKKTLSTSDEAKEDSGKDYPIDIWFLISEYISPESIGTFASICKTSFEVTCTAKFWFSLYKRYYRVVPTMPEELYPEYLVRKYCLRTNVVRALFHMYTPFFYAQSIYPLSISEHPNNLTKRICHSQWYQVIKCGDRCIFYFKLKERTNTVSPHSRSNTSNLRDLLEMLDDVSANPEDHCRVLKVVCKHFTQVPPVLGLVLQSVTVRLSEGFRYQRIQLNFGSGISQVDTVTIVLDMVVSYHVLDWWHPLYPYNYKMQHLIQQEL